MKMCCDIGKCCIFGERKSLRLHFLGTNNKFAWGFQPNSLRLTRVTLI